MKKIFFYFAIYTTISCMTLLANASFNINIINPKDTDVTAKITLYYLSSIKGDTNAARGKEYTGSFHGKIHKGTEAKVVLPTKDYLVVVQRYFQDNKQKKMKVTCAGFLPIEKHGFITIRNPHNDYFNMKYSGVKADIKTTYSVSHSYDVDCPFDLFKDIDK